MRNVFKMLAMKEAEEAKPVVDSEIEPSGFWEMEDFEETVAKGLILQYETTRHANDKRNCPEFHIPFGEAQALLRKTGCYFAPNDRAYYAGFGIQPDVDGIPSYAAFSSKNPRESSNTGEYGWTTVLRRILPAKGKSKPQLPRGWFCDRSYHYLFEQVHFYPSSNGVAVGRMMLALSEGGEPIPVYINRVVWNGFRDIRVKDYGHDGNIVPGLSNWSERGVIALFYWCDRVNMFNVMAQEGEAKALFGIYESQIKSLFYARKLPMTTTGRKKPILHWVKAHQRRIKEGIDIDIRKHLRGESKFEMNGTRFSIVSPHRDTANQGLV